MHKEKRLRQTAGQIDVALRCSIAWVGRMNCDYIRGLAVSMAFRVHVARNADIDGDENCWKDVSSDTVAELGEAIGNIRVLSVANSRKCAHRRQLVGRVMCMVRERRVYKHDRNTFLYHRFQSIVSIIRLDIVAYFA